MLPGFSQQRTRDDAQSVRTGAEKPWCDHFEGSGHLEVTSWRIAPVISHCFAWKCVMSFRQVFWRREKAQQSFSLRYFDLKRLFDGRLCLLGLKM